MSFRSFLFWLHLSAGVVAGSVVLVMSVTGVLLTYEKQMVAWAERSPLAAAPSPGAVRLPVEALVAKVLEVKPSATPATVTVRSGANEPVTVSLGRDGQVLAERLHRRRSSAKVRSDCAGSSARSPTGIAGSPPAASTAPRAAPSPAPATWRSSCWSSPGPTCGCRKAWTRLQLRNITWFRRGLPGKARDFNWHNTIGFWSFAPLFVVVLSATVISYPWASNLVYRAVGEQPPGAAAAAWAARRARRPERRETPALAGLDLHLARAEQHVPDWRTISLRVPTSEKAPLVFTIDRGSGGQPQKRGTLTLDRATGAVVKWETFASNSLGRRVRTVLRFAHTGEVLGLPGQTIAGIASAGGAVLVYTGLALSLRRFVAWRRRRVPSTSGRRRLLTLNPTTLRPYDPYNPVALRHEAHQVS